ncbi:energy-coupling factor transporter transmembrane component T family protein [Companilactobacillus keshanensis]|uniref:Energy-coupling factor transporter transmembrane component T family protein n=1 Tax=Companilactobacillus keshanensis TaxID=2486003 RepID=A0ABW4BT00_9LACO|nr:energy-coupling factor transporter transmembrane component T [Companilactobacillus keshanensis]
MVRDITLGEYYFTDSAIHSLDPRTKLMGVLIYIISLFIIHNPILYLFSLVYILVLYRMAKVPVSYLLRGLKGIIILLLFTFFFRLIATPGTTIVKWWVFDVTNQGVVKAIALTSRIALMIVGASLLSYTSTPKSLADGLEKAFLFLKRINVPIHEMTVIIMIAFRFIPIIIEELNVLIDAQSSRGIRFENVGVMKKMKNMTRLLLPLFLSIIRKASDLAMAMETRGYTGRNEMSRMYPLRYSRSDYVAYMIIFLSFVVLVGLNFVI